MPRVSALLDSALLSTVHVYARVHTSIYIYIYTHVMTMLFVKLPVKKLDNSTITLAFGSKRD